MNKKQIRLTESDLKQIVKESVNRIVKESDELDANDWKARYLKNAHYPNEPVDMKDIENKASWEAFDDNVNSLYGQRGCYDDDYASQAYADDPLSDFYGLENKNTYDLKGYLAKRKLNKLTKNESKDMNKKLIKLTEGDLHKIVKESVNKVLTEQMTEDFLVRFAKDKLNAIITAIEEGVYKDALDMMRKFEGDFASMVNQCRTTYPIA